MSIGRPESHGKGGDYPFAVGDYWAQADPEIMDYQGVTIFKDFISTPIDVVMAFGGWNCSRGYRFGQ